MPQGLSDDRYAAYFTDLLKRDLAGSSPGIPAQSWEWTCVLLWMAEEARSLVERLTLSPDTRQSMLELAEKARAEARRTRRSSPDLVPAII